MFVKALLLLRLSEHTLVYIARACVYSLPYGATLTRTHVVIQKLSLQVGLTKAPLLFANLRLLSEAEQASAAKLRIGFIRHRFGSISHQDRILQNPVRPKATLL